MALKYKTTLFYLILVFILGIGQDVFASKNRQKNFKSKDNYVLETRENYDFKACQKFNKEDGEHFYYLKCIDGELETEEEVYNLQRDIKAINVNIYKTHFLEDIKKQTIDSLKVQQSSLTNILKCFESSTTPECEKIKSTLIGNTKKEITSLREIMALMDSPSIFRTDRQRLYTKDIEHKVGDTDIPPLKISEIKKLEDRQIFINDQIEQQWFKSAKDKHKCVTKDGEDRYTLKDKFKGVDCKQLTKLYRDHFKDNEIDKLREKSQKLYFEKIDSYPILSKLKLAGDESDSVVSSAIKSELINNLKEINNSLNKTISLKKYELPQLIKNEKVVENFLNSSGPNQILCDIAQDYHDKLFYDELKIDFLIAGASLAGGGICALTAGLGCFIGAGLVAEAASLYVSNDREEDENLLFYTGLSNSQKLNERENDFTLSLIIAPLAIGGELLGTSLKVAKQVTKTTKNIPLKPENSLVDSQKNKILNIPSQKIVINSSEDLKYQFLNYNLGGPSLNASWIDSALNNKAAFYLDIENAAMKRINDTLGDKNLVTSLTNLHKKLTSDKITAILKSYPSISFEIYSDFKSIRYAFLPKNIPEDLKSELLKKLDEAYSSANNEFESVIKNIKLPDTESPKNWFLAGTSKTADEAGLASKKSRTLIRDAQGIVAFDDVVKLIETQRNDIISIQTSLSKNTQLIKANVLSKLGDDQYTFNEEVIDLLRKYPQDLNQSDIKQAMKQIEKEYGLKINPTDTKAFIEYVHGLNSLTPGLWLSKREIANLDKAAKGGLTGDVTGLGSKNIQQVAIDIAKAKKEGQDIYQTVKAIRQGEVEVTKVFNSIKDNFEKSVRGHLQERGIAHTIKCSGDDCAVVLKESLSTEQQSELITLFSKQDHPSQYRMSFIPDGVEESVRSQLAVHGEMLEKVLRKSLRGVDSGFIHPEDLKNITIATSMPDSLNKGQIKIIAKGNSAPSHENMIKIQAHLAKAIEKVNQEINSNYSIELLK